MRWADADQRARLVGVASLLAAALLIVFSWEEISQAPAIGDSPFGQIFGARPVAIALRIAVAALSSYLFASIVGLSLEGRWVVKAGPGGAEVEPSRPLDLVRDGDEDAEERFSQLEEALQELWDALEALRDEVGLEQEE